MHTVFKIIDMDCLLKNLSSDTNCMALWKSLESEYMGSSTTTWRVFHPNQKSQYLLYFCTTFHRTDRSDSRKEGVSEEVSGGGREKADEL